MLELPSYEQLSKEQDRILNLPLDRSHIVMGPPGSGKTVLAIYRAEMLHKRYDTSSLLMMYGKLLATYTQKAVDSRKIEGIARTYHSWFQEFYKEAYGHRAPTVGGLWNFDWERIFKEMISNPPPDRLKRHVIIDEGQDMPTQFYNVMSIVAKTMTIFADENQSITEYRSTIREIKESTGIESQHLLTRNYRNTKSIAAVAAHFHAGIQTGIAWLADATREGDPPALIRHETIDKWVTWLVRYSGNRSDRTIGVFLPRLNQMQALFHALESKRLPSKPEIYFSNQRKVYRKVDFEKPGIKIISYPSAKGLEFDTVCIPSLQQVRHDPAGDDFKMLYYVLASRARDELYFLYSGRGEPAAVSALPSHLLDVRA